MAVTLLLLTYLGNSFLLAALACFVSIAIGKMPSVRGLLQARFWRVIKSSPGGKRDLLRLCLSVAYGLLLRLQALCVWLSTTSMLLIPCSSSWRRPHLVYIMCCDIVVIIITV